MKRSTFFSYVVALFLALMVAACGQTTCVTFDPLAVGTIYGSTAGNVPGDLIFTENTVPVHVVDFQSPSGPAFYQCVVEPAAALAPPFGSGNIMNTNNIALEFIFTGLPYTVQTATFIYADLGGSEYIQANGVVATQFVGDLATLVPPYVLAPGIVIAQNITTPRPGGVSGVLIIEGNVDQLHIGGQEFYIDNVCAAEN